MDNTILAALLKRHEGFAKAIGLRLTKAEAGYAEGEIDINQMHHNPIGSVHGGCIFTLADTIGGAAVASNGVECTTLSSYIDYLNAAIESKKLIAKATPVRVGKKVCVYNVNVYDEAERHIAKVSITYYVMNRDKNTRNRDKKHSEGVIKT